jgi:hypothetical protein
MRQGRDKEKKTIANPSVDNNKRRFSYVLAYVWPELRKSDNIIRDYSRRRPLHLIEQTDIFVLSCPLNCWELFCIWSRNSLLFSNVKIQVLRRLVQSLGVEKHTETSVAYPGFDIMIPSAWA